MNANPAKPDTPRPPRTPPALLLVAGTLVVGVALFCLHLWPEWSANPDLSHGYFAPLVFFFLVWESRPPPC